MAYIGTWKYEREENLEQFLLAVGIPADKAKTAATLNSILQCSKAGDTLTIKVSVKGETKEVSFKMGVPFEMDMPHLGVKETVTATEEGGKLVIRGTATESREVTGDTMIVTVTKPGVDIVGKRYLKRV
ncbi:fatty acid-binding protein, intestinal-like [Glandiceps talaboti]